jgi:hypothetical protein
MLFIFDVEREASRDPIKPELQALRATPGEK